MTTEMYGSPLGFRTYDEDMAKLSQMAAQTGLLRAQAAHQGTLMDLNRAQTDMLRRKTEMEAEFLRRSRQLGAGGPPLGDFGPQSPVELVPPIPGGPPIQAEGLRMSQLGLGSPAGDQRQQDLEKLRRQAALHEEFGQFKEAANLRHRAGQLESAWATADANKALETRRRQQTALARLQRGIDIMSGVTSKEGHEAALMTWMNDPELSQQEIPQVFREYDQAKIDQAVGFTKGYIERKRAEAVAAENASRDRLRRAERENKRELRKLREREVEVREAAEARRAGEGGSGKAPPKASQNDREVVRGLLRQHGFAGDMEEGTGLIASSDVAERARRLLAERKNLSGFAEAAELIIAEDEAAGRLRKPQAGPLGRAAGESASRIGGKPGGYRAPSGKPPPKVLPLPRFRQDLQKGRVYDDGKGGLVIFDGFDSKGRPIARPYKVSAVAESALLAAADQDEDEDDDDEEASA